MKYKIIADSCCDLNEQIKSKMNISIVPITINLGNKIYQDDENLDTTKLLEDMKKSKVSLKTASPSPDYFLTEYKKADNIFVVTLSSALSSTYNNAVMAKNMLFETVENKFIHIFDSLSASVGETLVALKIHELIKKGIDNAEIVKNVDKYIKGMKTFFIIESLENLIKAGRISSIKGKLASLLSIKPIMRGNENGEIDVLERVRGSKRAFDRLVKLIGEHGKDLEDKTLGIAHCHCPEKAAKFKEQVKKLYNFKDIIIVQTAGTSTVYADKEGLVIAF